MCVFLCVYLPALNMRLPLFQHLQFLHLPFGLIDIGANGFHHLQRLLHHQVVVVFLWGSFQQLLNNHREQKHQESGIITTKHACIVNMYKINLTLKQSLTLTDGITKCFFKELWLKLCLWYVQRSCYCKMGCVEEDTNL